MRTCLETWRVGTCLNCEDILSGPHFLFEGYDLVLGLRLELGLVLKLGSGTE